MISAGAERRGAPPSVRTYSNPECMMVRAIAVKAIDSEFAVAGGDQQL
jgi:hypothetical protein